VARSVQGHGEVSTVGDVLGQDADDRGAEIADLLVPELTKRRYTDEQHLSSRKDRAWVDQSVFPGLRLQRFEIDADLGEGLGGVPVGTVEALCVLERDQVGGECEDVPLDDLEGKAPARSW
jgi:hypothetical protein